MGGMVGGGVSEDLRMIPDVIMGHIGQATTRET